MLTALYTTPDTDYFKEFSTTVLNYALGGFFRSLTSPCMWHYNGSTYAVGYKSNVYNNQVWILKQTGITVESYNVGTGTDGSEPENHPTPLLYVNESTGYVYVIQNEFHVDRFLVWRSDNPQDISSFSLVGYFGANESYLCLISYSGTNCVFQTRNGSSSDYDQSLISVDLDSPSGYSETIITEANYSVTNTRHYTCACWKYGTSDYTAWGINKRKDGTIKYYCTQLLIVENGEYDNIYNAGLTYSKSISLDGVITNAELDDEYNILGNPADNTTTITEVRMIQVNDDVYTIHLSDDSTNTYTATKINIKTGTQTPLELPISDIYDDGSQLDNCSAMFYNGDTIIVRLKRTDTTSLYSLNLECTTFTYLQDIDISDGMYLGIPINLDKIPRNQRYMIVGRSNGTSNVPYIVTNRKFL